MISEEAANDRLILEKKVLELNSKLTKDEAPVPPPSATLHTTIGSFEQSAESEGVIDEAVQQRCSTLQEQVLRLGLELSKANALKDEISDQAAASEKDFNEAIEKGIEDRLSLEQQVLELRLDLTKAHVAERRMTMSHDR